MNSAALSPQRPAPVSLRALLSFPEEFLLHRALATVAVMGLVRKQLRAPVGGGGSHPESPCRSTIAQAPVTDCGGDLIGR